MTAVAGTAISHSVANSDLTIVRVDFSATSISESVSSGLFILDMHLAGTSISVTGSGGNTAVFETFFEALLDSVGSERVYLIDLDLTQLD